MNNMVFDIRPSMFGTNTDKIVIKMNLRIISKRPKQLRYQIVKRYRSIRQLYQHDKSLSAHTARNIACLHEEVVVPINLFECAVHGSPVTLFQIKSWKIGVCAWMVAALSYSKHSLRQRCSMSKENQIFMWRNCFRSVIAMAPIPVSGRVT